MVNVGGKHGMKESLLEEVAPYTSLHWVSLVKGSFFVCTTPVAG